MSSEKTAEHDREEEIRKRKLYNRWDVAFIIVVLLVGVFVCAWYNQLSSAPNVATITMTSTFWSSSTTTLLRVGDFNLTYHRGCLRIDPTTGWLVEHFVVTVYNRYNVSVEYVNTSVYVANIVFADGQFISDSLKPILETQGSIHNETLTFTVDFPITGIAYGKAYENNRVASGLFAVFVAIKQYDFVQEFPVEPNIPVSASVPTCLG